MLQLPIIGLFLRTIPEGILGMCAVYVFSGKKFDWKRIFVSGVILGLYTYVVRLLPINFGVHTVLVLLMFILLIVQVNKINVIRAVTFCIVYTIILFISEAVTIPVIPKITGKPLEEILNNPTNLVVYGIPSLFLTFIIIITVYIIKLKFKKK